MRNRLNKPSLGFVRLFLFVNLYELSSFIKQAFILFLAYNLVMLEPKLL